MVTRSISIYLDVASFVVVLELGASHPDKVAGIVMVDPAPLVFPLELKAGVEAIVSAIEAKRATRSPGASSSPTTCS